MYGIQVFVYVCVCVWWGGGGEWFPHNPHLQNTTI